VTCPAGPLAPEALAACLSTAALAGRSTLQLRGCPDSAYGAGLPTGLQTLEMDQVKMEAVGPTSVYITCRDSSLTARRLGAILAATKLPVFKASPRPRLQLLGCPVPGKEGSYNKWAASIIGDAAKLKELSVFRSLNAKELDPNDFAGLPSLTSLHLRDMPLSSLDGDLLSNLPTLTYLSLQKTELTSIPATLFRPLTELKILDIAHNPQISSLPTDVLATNTKLTLFKATNIGIDKLPENLFYMTPQLTHVHLDDNKISSIPDTFLHSLKSLKELILNENLLTNTGISNDTFKYLSSLKSLYLNKNMMTSPITGYLSPMKETLTAVYIKNNSLSTVEDEWAKNFKHITKLDLRSNKIAGDLTEQSLTFKDSTTIKLEDNAINRIIFTKEARAEDDIFLGRPKCTTITKLSLTGNPITCDCHAVDLKQILNMNSTSCLTITDKELTCSSTEVGSNCKNQPVKMVPSSCLTCTLGHSSCPLSCRCSYNAALKETTVDCSHSRLVSFSGDIPAVGNDTGRIKLILRNSSIEHLLGLFSGVTDSNLDKIGFLDLSHNHIVSLETSYLPPKLTRLHLNNNRIKTLDKTSIAYLETFPETSLKLGHNPFSCYCDSVNFIHFLIGHHSKVSDPEDIAFSCSPTAPFNTTTTRASTVCADHTATALLACVGLLLLLVALLAVLSRERAAAGRWLRCTPCLLRRHPTADSAVSYVDVSGEQKYWNRSIKTI
jgi:Leucine-rich repeat (LRR) protein